MEFKDSFLVPASLDVTWRALSNMERVYGCLPGAEISDIEEDRCAGTLRMKVGPIATTYAGSAQFEHRDHESGLLVIAAEGADKRGRGTAKARMRAQMTSVAEDQTRVEMINEVRLTGRIAQFGRGVIEDVSREMLGQFAANLADVVERSRQDGYADTESAEVDDRGAPGREENRQPEDQAAQPPPAGRGEDALDLGSMGVRILRRRAPKLLIGVGVVALALLLFRALGRR